MQRASAILLLAGLLAASNARPGTTAARISPQAPHFRRPVALVALPGRVYVANSRSGTISVIDSDDSPSPTVIDEVPVGQKLAALVSTPSGHSLLAADEGAGQLVRLTFHQGSLHVTERLNVGMSPINVRVAPDGSFCSVSLLWAHRIVLVALDQLDDAANAQGLRLIRTIDLPFAPRLQWIAPDGNQLVVADAFGGQVAAVDLPEGRIRALRVVQGHNIRGLAAAPDGHALLLTHPMMEQVLPTTHDNVFWGSVVHNVVRSVALDHLLVSSSDHTQDALVPTPITRWELTPLGGPGNAAGDPGPILVTPEGQIIVALGGVNEVAMRPGIGEDFARIAVGRRPVALALSSDRQRVFVANEMDDSISVIDLATLRRTCTLSLGPTPQPSAADRGEALFYNSGLSLDGWYSCHTCHTDGHSSGLLNDNPSDGSFQTPKRILSLLGAADTGPWAWNGSNATLEQQIHKSILGTMQGKPDSATADNVSALAHYLCRLRPPPSLAAARGNGDVAAIERGRIVFEKLECARCHEPPTYTSAKTYDVGLRDQAGLKLFNPPSLRGVSQRSAFLHDNRATSLREVFVRFRHPDDTQFPEHDLTDLLEFLRSI